jgi:hypothetical protein
MSSNRVVCWQQLLKSTSLHTHTHTHIVINIENKQRQISLLWQSKKIQSVVVLTNVFEHGITSHRHRCQFCIPTLFAAMFCITQTRIEPCTTLNYFIVCDEKNKNTK